MLLIADLPSINTVRIGHLFHKPSVVHDLLGKSVRAVAHEFLYEGDSTVSFGGGSCTLVSHRQQAFVVTTRHQLCVPKGDKLPTERFDTIRFATSEDGYLKNIPVDRCFHERFNEDQDYHDLLFFRVGPRWLSSSADRAYFFPLEDFSRKDRISSFFYGYPISRNEVDYNPLHAHSCLAYIDGHLDLNFKCHSEYLRRYTYTKKAYEMNGFSGGAAFSLIGDLEDELQLVLDGIIVMASNGFLHAIDVDYLMAAMIRFETT